jgi:alpha-D-ribose 1-methylphosphonate 5-triphosphate synthase subunit PhnG
MNYYKVLANSPEEKVCRLAAKVTEAYSSSQIKLLSGPRKGLVMLRVQETVANSQFNAGEILVTEVRLELDGQFGFGMVTGDRPRHALAVALIDAALRKGEGLAGQLTPELDELSHQLERQHRDLNRLIGISKVEFETM